MSRYFSYSEALLKMKSSNLTSFLRKPVKIRQCYSVITASEDVVSEYAPNLSRQVSIKQMIEEAEVVLQQTIVRPRPVAGRLLSSVICKYNIVVCSKSKI